jgi:predicted DsbA family dithiol-disulfide isomerase
VKPASVRLSVWSDYVCPFCYLELPVLDRLEAEPGDRAAVDWRGFELRPEPVPTLDPDAPYLHGVWGQSVYRMARARGMTLSLPPVQPRSRKALEAVEHARAEGRFDAVHRLLFRAFFEHGQDLASVEVLADVAAAAGLDPDGLREALAEERHLPKVLAGETEARHHGLRGVPALVVAAPDGRELLLQGAQPYEAVRAAVERAAA